MRPQDVIARKRDGKVLTDVEIASFVDGLTTGAWADYQITAMVMAMILRGLNKREQNSITRGMLYSGSVMDFSDIDAPKADKHSTGGVGDKTSLVIAPILAACGIAVPMISGRGLGHTGGTLDKLESIPGFNVRLPFKQIKTVMRACGLVLVGQTKEIAPADRKLYALRDATATVPYIPLIVASIMSKKLAEGLDALVLDVKTGSGAFIQKQTESIKLAKALCETGRSFKVKTQALVTDMSQPLGQFSGNALEVYECLKILRGESTAAMEPTLELSVELSANLLVQCGIEKDIPRSKAKIQSVLDSGEALERFRHNIELQSGDPRVCDKPETLLSKGIKKIDVLAASSGYLSAVDTFAVGNAICELGGGRIKAEDSVDHAVGFESTIKVGDRIKRAQPIGVIYARRIADADSISESITNAYRISTDPSGPKKLIRAAV